jgi:hypothetical protein
MTVTIQVDDGPTVRLTYTGGWDGGPIILFTRITVGDQTTTRGPGYLHDLLVDAGSLLLLYAANKERWPADLRPAADPPPRTPT